LYDPAINEPTVTDVAGVPYDKITNLSNVRHLAQIDDSNVILLSGRTGAATSLTTIPLP